jgi:hypothetical protein
MNGNMSAGAFGIDRTDCKELVIEQPVKYA